MTLARSSFGETEGPLRTCEASSRSALIEERKREKTASPMSVRGIPSSKALTAVHLPVHFWPAKSRIFSTRGSPSESLTVNISAVISIK